MCIVCFPNAGIRPTQVFKLHILMISDVYFPRINGVSTSISTFRNELLNLGHQVTLIAPRYSEHDVQEDWIIRIPSLTVPLDPEDRIMRRGFISALTPALAGRRFDLLHIQTPFMAHYAGVELSRKLGLPRVVTYHTHFEEYFHHYLPWLPRTLLKSGARYFNRQQCNDVDAIIVPSNAMLNVLQGYGIQRPIEVIATGLEKHLYTPGNGLAFRKKYNVDPQRPVLIHIGRVAHEKNIDFLLHMVDVLRHAVPDVLFIIAGEGPAESHLVRLTRQLGLERHVLFVGYLDRATELLDCYRAGDVFVFGSRTETQGLVLLEAMAQGIPVVSIAELGTNDILGANKGALISAEDKHQFAIRVQSLLQDPHLHKQVSADAYEYSTSWSAHAFAAKAVSFYEYTIRQSRVAGTACVS